MRDVESLGGGVRRQKIRQRREGIEDYALSAHARESNRNLGLTPEESETESLYREIDRLQCSQWASRESHVRLTGIFHRARTTTAAMNGDALDMDEVTLELTDAEIEAIDDRAFRNHRGNREAAIREALDEWLKQRD